LGRRKMIRRKKMKNRKGTIIHQVVITKKEIDEIAHIVSRAYCDVYEGRYCRIDNRENDIAVR